MGVGFYRTTVFDVGSGCSQDQTREIIFSAQPVTITDVSTTDQFTCDPFINGGTATLNAVTPFAPGTSIVAEYEIYWYDGALGDDFATASADGVYASDVETISNLVEGTYYVQVTRRAGFPPGAGCSSSPFRVDVFDLHEDPILTFDVPQPDITCDPALPGTGSVVVDSDVDVPLANWDWFEQDLDGDGVFNEPGDDDFPAAPSIVNTLRSSSYSGLNAGTYHLSVLDVNGCTNTIEVEIPRDETQSTPNIVDIDPVLPTGCNALDGSLTVTSLTIGTTTTVTLPDVADPLQYTYAWYFDTFDAAGLIAGETTNSISPINVGTYFVVVTSGTTGCESLPRQIEVDDSDVIYPELSLVESLPQLSCSDTGPFTGELTATVDAAAPSGPYTFEWFYEGSTTLPDNAITGNPVEPVTSGNISVLDSLPVGRYDVIVTNTATGCTETKLYIVENESLNFIPVINTGTEPVTDCDADNGGIFGKAVPFTDNNNIDIYPLFPYDYQIDIYSGSLPNIDATYQDGDLAHAPSVGANVPVLVSGQSSGDYTVRIIDNKTGCYSVKTDFISESFAFPEVEVIMENPLISCDPADPDGQLQALVNGSTAASGFRFEWYEGTTAAGTIIYDRNRLIGVDSGFYTVRVTSVISGCSTDATGQVTSDQLLAPTPTPELLSDRYSCIVEDGELTVSVNGETGQYSFEWFVGADGTGTPIGSNPRLQDLAEGTYSVRAYDNVTGCSSIPVSIDVADLRTDPEFYFETEGSKCDEPTGLARVVVTNNVNVSSIDWTDLNTGAGLGLGQQINDVESGDYSALVTTVYGCENEGVATVGTVITNYNLVTSDGDGFNDNFQIDCITRFPNNNVKIFNRAGVLVYEIDGYDNAEKSFKGLGEKGAYAIGNDLPNGTYFYVIDKGDGSKLISGFLELIR